MPYTPTSFVERSAPPLTAAELNKIGTGVQSAQATADAAAASAAALGTDTAPFNPAVTLAGQAGSEVAPPPAGNQRVFSYSNPVGRQQIKVQSPTGLAQTLQSSLITSRQWAILPATGSSLSTIGTAVTTTGTIANPTQTISSISSRQRRFSISTGTAAGTVASVRTAQSEMVRGNGANVGGFDFYARFTLETLATGMRAFIGITDVLTAPTNVDPTTSTTPGKVGLAINVSTGNWNIVNNVTGTAPAVIALGGNFPVDLTTVIELWLHADPNGAGINYRVCNIVNAGIFAETSGALTTNIPTNVTYLSPVAWVTNNASAANAGIAMSRMLGETLDGS